VPRTGDNIRIPQTEEEALGLAFQVKPTKDMPRPGATKTPKKSKAKSQIKISANIEKER
jgi:hypothetical protein